MAYNFYEGKRKKVFVDEHVFKTTQAVIKTKSHFLGLEVVVGSHNRFLEDFNPSEYFGIVVQTPDARGILHDFTDFFQRIE